MKSPVNKSLNEFKKRKTNQYFPMDKNGVSIITCTNKPHTLKNIFNNFNRQIIKEKELIIVINNNKINQEYWKHIISKYNNIRIFKLDEKNSLGKCLNFGVKKAKFEIIAKFDDDDYYGPKYILDSLKYFKIAKASLIGKHSIFVYFVKDKHLALKDPGFENQYTYFLNGATMIFKKEIFKIVQFRDISVNEDVFFCKDCIKNNIKVYSGNKYHFAYLRYPSKNNHTWKIDNENLMNLYCKTIDQVDDFKKYVNV